MTLRSKVLLLVLVASPLVASPPVVLPLTLALPDVAFWSLSLWTLTQLLLVTLVFTDVVELTVLLDPGPVVLMLPDASPPSEPEPPPTLELLSTVTLADRSLLFIALPDVASPPVVLPLTFALPVRALWSLSLDTLTWLLFVRRVRTVVCAVTWLDELGPVLLMLPVSAATIPVVRLKPKTVAAAAR